MAVTVSAGKAIGDTSQDESPGGLRPQKTIFKSSLRDLTMPTYIVRCPGTASVAKARFCTMIHHRLGFLAKVGAAHGAPPLALSQLCRPTGVASLTSAAFCM
jgi:hypothetical protein